MKIICVIPARYASSRLPGKPLVNIAGKPMIQHVYEQAKQAKRPSAVIVATDHQSVYDAVQAFGGQVMLTSPHHATGTDRLAEVAQSFIDADIIINVQGDEPLIAPEVIDLLASAFDDDACLNMATLMTEMAEEEYHTSSAVKVVTDLKGYALYFSRALIPFSVRQPRELRVHKHIGIYAYRREFLLQFAKLTPTLLEQAESLEQLRALEHGFRIKVLKTGFKSIGVDTAEDLEKVNQVLGSR